MSARSYLVLGAGAIGAGVGGLLHRSGADVTLVARGEHLARLREGLRLTVGHRETERLDVPVAALDAMRPRAGLVVLLAVKSHQSAAALDGLERAGHHEPVIVCLQNGVSNEREALRRTPDVHGVCVMMPASMLAPGEVTLHSAGVPGLLDVGRYPGGVDDVDHRLAADLEAAGFASRPRADVMAWKHRKLLMNLGNAVDAACAPGPDADRLAELAVAEGERVLAAAGVPVVSAERDAERRGTLLRPLVGRDRAGGSTWQSLARGDAHVEADHLNGEVCLLGRLHGVPTPVNALLRRVVTDLAAGSGAPRTLAARPLLERLGDGPAP